MSTHVPQSGDTYELADAPLSNGEGYTLADEPRPPAPPATPPAPPVTPPAPEAKAQGKPGAVSRAQAAPKAPRRRRSSLRWDAPAWAVSLLVHVTILGLLGLLTLTPEVRKAVANLNTALVAGPAPGEQELTPILADPVPGQERQEAVGADMPTFTQGVGGSGTGPPSNTPAVGLGTGGVGPVTERSGLPGIRVVAAVPSISNLPAMPLRDLGGGGMIAGDVTYETQDIGTALDQLAREILRHLEAHKLTVVWLFDESKSMKDDQKAVKEKFGRVASELKLNLDENKKTAGALNHAIVGFGQDIHYVLEKPTIDIDQIGRAIDRLRVDDSGVENTLHAIQEVIGKYGRLIGKDRRLLIVLVTDESGDDGSYVEEARQVAVSRGVPLYVIGRQALFGYSELRLLYIDKVTGDHYWPTIRRGPETAGLEALQWDGLHRRWDEQPSGFAPYELARLAKDTGGIYFLLPTEEHQRLRQREQAYMTKTLKEYVPDYESRASYEAKIRKSELRRDLVAIIDETRDYGLRLDFALEPEKLLDETVEAAEKATTRLAQLNTIAARLRQLVKLRDREPEKRWQAAYDLMIGQIAASQVIAFEYRAVMMEMNKAAREGKLPAHTTPTPDLHVWWHVGHAREPKAPKELTAKAYAEAEGLLRRVIERHPHTPWADLAQDTLDRGLSASWGGAKHSTRYDERAKLVPKY